MEISEIEKWKTTEKLMQPRNVSLRRLKKKMRIFWSDLLRINRKQKLSGMEITSLQFPQMLKK